MLFLKKIKLQAIILIACSFLSILLFGCSENKRNKVYDIKELIIDTIAIPINIENSTYFGKINFIKDANDEVLSFLIKNNFMLYKYSITQETFIDSISFQKYEPIFVDYAFQGMDSLIILLENYQLVLITPKVEKNYDLKPLFLEHIDSLASPTYKLTPLHIEGNIFSFNIATNRPRHDFTKPNPNEILYNYIIQVRLDYDSIRFVGKYNPYDPEILENGYYEFRHHYFSNPNTLTYFYDFKNEIFQINLENDETLNTKLKPTTYDYIASEPIKHDSIPFNIYLFEYLYKRNSIVQFLFDKSHNRFLFFMQKSSPYLKEDGSYIKQEELFFTLFVMDQFLKLEKEIIINPHIISNYSWSFITSKGLHIPIAKEYQNLNKNETLFYRINLD